VSAGYGAAARSELGSMRLTLRAGRGLGLRRAGGRALAAAVPPLGRPL